MPTDEDSAVANSPVFWIPDPLNPRVGWATWGHALSSMTTAAAQAPTSHDGMITLDRLENAMQAYVMIDVGAFLSHHMASIHNIPKGANFWARETMSHLQMQCGSGMICSTGLPEGFRLWWRQLSDAIYEGGVGQRRSQSQTSQLSGRRFFMSSANVQRDFVKSSKYKSAHLEDLRAPVFTPVTSEQVWVETAERVHANAFRILSNFCEWTPKQLEHHYRYLGPKTNLFLLCDLR
jgi:hypothetical protein